MLGKISTSSVQNFILVTSLQYIYRKRCEGKLLNFKELEGIFEQHKTIEKYIAIKNNNAKKHNTKWNIRDSSIDEDYTTEYILSI